MNILRYMLLVAFGVPCFLFGQNNFIYNGGSDDGLAIGYGGTATNNSIYQGGIDDGLAIAYSATPTQNTIYQGGTDDGFGMNHGVTPSNNNIYEGGIDDGFGFNQGLTPSNNKIYQGGIDDGFAQFHLEDALPLRLPPLLEVEWLAFEVTAVAGEVQLSWETAREINHQVFEVERSKDAVLAERIGSAIPGKGSAEQGESYISLDRKPLTGSSFYRIRAIDNDGNTSHTAWKQVWFSENQSLNIIAFPNPVQDFLNITISSTSASGISIRVVDVLGKITYQKSLVLNQNIYKHRLDMREYAEGMYFIELTTSEGFKKTFRIIK